MIRKVPTMMTDQTMPWMIQQGIDNYDQPSSIDNGLTLKKQNCITKDLQSIKSIQK